MSVPNWLDLSSTSNRHIQTYVRGFVDISGGDLIVRRNHIYVQAGDISLNGRLLVNNDASLNQRLFVGSDASFAGSVFVQGDVSLNGNVYVTTQAAADNSNKVATTAYVTSAVSSITGATASFTGDVSVNQRLYVGSDASFAKRVFAQGDVSVNQRLYVGSDGSLTKRLFVQGDVSLNQRLYVGSDASLAGGLFVQGDASLNQRLYVGSDVSFGQRLFVLNDTSLNGNVSIGKDLTLGGNLYVLAYTTRQTVTELSYQLIVTQDISSNGRLFLSGDASVNQRLYVGSDVSLGQRLFVFGDASLGGSISVANNVTAGGRLAVSNDVSFNQRLYVGSDVSLAQRLFTSGDVSMNSRLYVGSDTSLGQRLFVFGDASFGGSVSLANTMLVGGRLIVSTDASFNQRLYVGSDVSLAQRLLVQGDVSFNKRLFVGSDASLGGRLYIAGDATMNQRLYVGSDVSLNGQLFVQGDVSLNGNVYVTTQASSDNSNKVATTAYVTSAVSSITGATASFTGDISINQRLYVGSDASLAGRLYVFNDVSLGGSVSLANTMLVGGRLFVQGDASLNKRLYVVSDISLGGRLFVQGDASLNQRLYVATDISLGGRLYVSGDTSLNQRLYVGSDASLGQRLYVSGDASLNQRLYVGSDVSLGQRLYVAGDASLNQRLYVGSDVSLGQRLFVAGDAAMNQRLYVATDMSLGGRLYLNTGSLYVNGVPFSGGSNSFTGDVSMTTRLYVGTDISMGARLFVAGDASLNQRLYVGSDVSFGQRLFVAGDVSFNQRLYVGSDASLGGRLFLVNDASLNGNVSIGKDLTVAGNFYVQAYTTRQMITELSYQLIIAEDISSNGRLFLSGDASLNQRLYVSSDVSMGGRLFSAGDVSHNARLYLGSDASLGGRLFVFGDTSLNGNVFVTTQSQSDNSNKVATTAYVKTAVSAINGATGSFVGDVSMNQRLYVGSDVSMGGRLFVFGDTSLNSRLSVGSDLSLGGRLYLNTGSLYVNGAPFSGGSTNFTTDVSMTANLYVTGGVNVVSSGLTASGQLYSSSGISTAGPLTTSAVPSTFGTGTWQAVFTTPGLTTFAMSPTGQYQMVGASGGTLYISQNYGSTWNSFGVGWAMSSSAISAANNFYAAGINGGTNIQYSKNFGGIFNNMSYTAAATSVIPSFAIGVTSNYVSFAAGSYGIYTSPNPLTTAYTQAQPAGANNNFQSVSMTGNGQIQVATNLSGGLYITTNYGSSWSVATGTSGINWFNISVSSNTGQYMLASAVNTYAYLSTNYGSTWTALSSGFTSGSNKLVAVSATGQYQVIVHSGVNTYVSNNFGTTWSAVSQLVGYGCSGQLQPIGISANGQYLSIAMNGSVYSVVNPVADTTFGGRLFVSSDILTLGSFVASNANGAPGYIAGKHSGVYGDGTPMYTSTPGLLVDPSYTTSTYISTVVSTVSAAPQTIPPYSLAISYTGQYQTVGYNNSGGLYVSSNFGASFTQITGLAYASYPTSSVPAVAMSYSGQYQVAVDMSGNFTLSNGITYSMTIYNSSNYGQTWSASTSPALSVSNGASYVGYLNQGFVVSANGQYMLYSQTIYYDGGSFNVLLSSNYGVTFSTVTLPSGNPQMSVQGTPVMSSDGRFMLLAAAYNNKSVLGFYKSTDFGKTWFFTNSSGWGGGACFSSSANGQYIANCNANSTYGNGPVTISTDYGLTWNGYNPSGSNNGTSSVSMDVTGKYMVTTISGTNGGVYYSSNYGVTWTIFTKSGISSAIWSAMSGNGQYILTANTTGVRLLTLPNAINTYGYTGTTNLYGSLNTIGNTSISGSATINVNAQICNTLTTDLSGTVSGIHGGTYLDGTPMYTAHPGLPLDASLANPTYVAALVPIVSSAPQNIQAYNFAISYNGQYQTIGYNSSGGLYVSSNYGATYTSITGRAYSSNTISSVIAVGMSATGQYQVTMDMSGQFPLTATSYPLSIYYSNNYGKTWSASTMPATTVNSSSGYVGYSSQTFAVSSTGQYQVYSQQLGPILFSSNYGVTFTTPSITLFTCVSNPVMSSNGQNIMIYGYNNQTVYGFIKSTNYGQTWSFVANASLNGNYCVLAGSASLQYLAQTTLNGSPYGPNDCDVKISNDFGQTWTSYYPTGGNYRYSSVSISATGQYMISTVNNYQYNNASYSTNYGVTWTNFSSGSITACTRSAMSGNGQYMLFANGYSGAAGVKYINLSNAINAYGNPAGTNLYGNLNLVGDASFNQRLYVASDVSFGAKLSVTGTLSKGGGSFDIMHPDPSKPVGTRLRHCFVEAPTRGDNIYRFQVTTVDLSATVLLPSYYKYLNEGTQIWVNPANCLGSGYGVLEDDNETVHITVSIEGVYNVLIIGTRKDQMMIDFFDNNGGVEYTMS